MKNNARIGVTWLTLVVFILFMIIPGYPAQNKQEKKGLKLIKEGEAHYDNFNFEKAVDNFKEAVKPTMRWQTKLKQKSLLNRCLS